MMTPADELEYIIKEIATHDIDDTKSYTIKSFPEIYFRKLSTYYIIKILQDYNENADVIKRFKEFINVFRSRKITIENKILNRDHKLRFYVNYLRTDIPIYYKDCIFTSPNFYIGTNCENCIFEGGE